MARFLLQPWAQVTIEFQAFLRAEISLTVTNLSSKMNTQVACGSQTHRTGMLQGTSRIPKSTTFITKIWMVDYIGYGT